MRVYEFAKQYNLVSKDVVSLLQKEGFLIKNHMSQLSDDELSFLAKKFNIPSSVDVLPNLHKEHLGDGPSRDKKESDQVKIKDNLFYIESMSLESFVCKTKQILTDVILTLLKQGKAVAKNSMLSVQDVEFLVEYYQIPACKKQSDDAKERTILAAQKGKGKDVRFPVVVVMGHVDHGKTTLLDAIRNSRMASKEAGGITQRLGAYKTKTPHGTLVFLDTPGHEAFSKMRQRGSSVADIAVLVIAADDGIKPQTIEAIRYIKELDIPTIIAFNKVDKVDEARIEKVKQQCVQHDLLPEEWGGTTICVSISAKTGAGVDHLLEVLALQAEIMELKTSKGGSAQGYVLESKLERGRGPVATVICQQGKLKKGDFFIAGFTTGKVISLTDEFGKQMQNAGPSIPIQVAGFDELAEIGVPFSVVSEKEFKQHRSGRQRDVAMGQFSSFQGSTAPLPVIVKSDTTSSLEVVVDGLKKIGMSKKNRFIAVVSASVGVVGEGDVLLADRSGAVIVGFNVLVENNAQLLARENKVEILSFSIIYKLFEEFDRRAIPQKRKETIREKIGEAEVLKIFSIKKLGVIAGCVIKDGRFVDRGYVKVFRGNHIIGEGSIRSLQRERRSVKEVHQGFECAFLIDRFSEWEKGDMAVCYADTITLVK